MNRRALAALGLVTLGLVADRAVIALSPSWAWMDCFAMTPRASPIVTATFGARNSRDVYYAGRIAARMGSQPPPSVAA